MINQKFPGNQIFDVLGKPTNHFTPDSETTGVLTSSRRNHIATLVPDWCPDFSALGAAVVLRVATFPEGCYPGSMLA